LKHEDEACENHQALQIWKYKKINNLIQIYTKGDEAKDFGSMYCDRSGRQTGFIFKIGQNVPNDIEDANPARIARIIMRHS